MKIILKIIALFGTGAFIFIGGSIYSGFYAEYSHRGPNGEYLFDVNTGIMRAGISALVVAVVLGIFLFRRKSTQKVNQTEQIK